MLPVRNLLLASSFVGLAALVVHGCASGNSTQAFGNGTDAGGSDASTSSSSGGGSGSSSGGMIVDAAQDTGMGVPADAMACTHNDDCKGASICTSGYACMGGLCIPTGKPQNCDDGVPCTTDSCDAMTNACVHTPVDANCPNGEYCDPVKNCLQTLPCTPGSSVCDRLDVNACDGLWTCDTTKMYCVQGSDPCPMVTNAMAQCTPGGDAGVGDAGALVTCTWTCNTGYVHVVWSGGSATQVTMFGSPPPAGGCECHQSSTTDTPDYTGMDSGFVDENCDGIDGTVANAIFVDQVTGKDTNNGSMAAPKKTIQAGIIAGSAVNKDVYVSKGTYNEHVDMADGVSLYGGYDASSSWSRAMANVTTIASPTTLGVSATNLSNAVTIQFFTVTTQDATGGSGQSVDGIRIAGCTGGVTVQGCTVSSGAGGSGVVPSPATTGAAGGNGSGASGGPSSCGATGGFGGPAVSGATGGDSGGMGGGPNGGSPGPGGSGGNACCIPGNGGPGGPGGVGGPGSPGADSNYTALTIGTLASDGSYTTADGAGGAAGTNGGGGGGGGSGGGAGSGCPLSCHDDTSGNGGGGGAGGCAGGAGGSGGGGGASLGIVIVGSAATIDQCQVNAGKGGGGAGGGSGGPGGSGGSGTGGGAGGGSAGSGGPGSNGAGGGSGGSGSGGTGGPSICVAYSGTVPNYTNSHCNRAGGGAAGASGGGLAPKGLPGIDSELRGL